MSQNTNTFQRPSVNASFLQIDIDVLWYMQNVKPAVWKFFIHCWCSDPYGSRWMRLHTDLKDKTLKEAKASMRELGLFEFKSEMVIENGQRRYETWVRNLKDDEVGVETTLPQKQQNSGGVVENPTWGANQPHLGSSGTPGGVVENPGTTAEALSLQSFQDALISKNTNDNQEYNLIICEQNLEVSSFDDSLRSSEVAGYEEEKPSVLTKDLEVLQHPLSNDEDLGSHSKTNSSSTKTTPNTEPSRSSSQKKSITSTKDDGSVESIRFRSPRDVNRAISPCDPCQRVERSEHAISPQNTSRSHQDAPQTSSTSANDQSHRNPTQSSLKAQLGGSQLESAIEELEESLQAVADDLELTVEGGIDELCRRFAGLATETEVELLPVPREYPYYDRMNEWVLYENKSIVCFVQRGLKTRRLTIGCFR